MAAPETKDQIKLSRSLVEKAKAEREGLLRQLEQSHDTIARSRKIISLLEQIIEVAEKK